MSTLEHVVELIHERVYRDFATALTDGDVDELTDRAAWMKARGVALVQEFVPSMEAAGVTAPEVLDAWEAMFTVLPDTMGDGERQYQIMQAALQRELTELREELTKHLMFREGLEFVLKVHKAQDGGTSPLHLAIRELLDIPMK